MKTIKLPININIFEEQRVFSSCIRYSYNRLKEGRDLISIEYQIKTMPYFSNLLTVYKIRCAIYKAQDLIKTGQEKHIFGGKYNFIQRYKNKITKEKYKENRLMPLYIIGENTPYGNRNFKLDMENNQIIYKKDRKEHIQIQLPKLRKNIKTELFELQRLCGLKQEKYSIDLTNKHICISFDETILKKNIKRQIKENRILGIDLNPNYMGISILEFNKSNEFKVIYKEAIDLSELTKKSGKSSDSKESKYLVNKKNHEIFQINQRIINLCIQYQVKSLAYEDLNMESENKGSRNYNRLVNNIWNRTVMIKNLQKWCNIYKIKTIDVNPVYSSFIGNVNYGDKNTPDMIAASIEIARRAYKKFTKGWFYPERLPESLILNLWKKDGVDISGNWKELFLRIKNLKVKYRVSLKDCNPLRVFSLSSKKSKINIYTYCVEGG